MASSNSTLKLLIDKKTQKVLFAEVTKHFVDFLFHVFSLPLGTLIKLLGSKQMVGCLGQLKQSIEALNETYLQPDIDTDDVLNPKIAHNGNILLLPNDATTDDKPDTPKTLYRCSNTNTPNPRWNCSKCSHMYVTEHSDAACPDCGCLMSVAMTCFMPPDREVTKKRKMVGGYVKEVVTYMVMDDLVVKPMSTISSITLINSFGVKDLSQLEEKTLPFGKVEALKLLKASLMTDQVLTTLFGHTIDA